MGDHERTLQTEDGDLCMKTKPISTRVGGTFGTLRFDERSFLITLLGFTQFWDYKPTIVVHADFLGVYTIDNF